MYQSVLLSVSLVSLVLSTLAFFYRSFFLGRAHLNEEATSSLLPYPHIPWRPTSSLSSVSAYLDQSSKIWTLDLPEATKLRLIVEMISTQYRHKELLEPWFNNWIAFLVSFMPVTRFARLRSSVSADYIAKNKHCFCSQSAILVDLILSHLRVDHAPLLFDFNHGSGGHFAIVAYLGTKSYIIDPNAMPVLNWDGTDLFRMTSSADRLENIKTIYRNTLVLPVSVPFSCHIEVGRINEAPASRVRLFKKFCAHLSHFVWLYFLALYYFSLRTL